jgi:hypothetical protein
MDYFGRHGVVGRALVAVVVFVFLAGNLPVAAQEDAEAPYLDLAAMHLFPNDLDAVNFPGYGLFTNGGTIEAEAIAAEFATEDRDYDATLAEYQRMGLRGAHAMKVSVPDVPGDSSSGERRYVNTWVAEFKEVGPRMDDAWNEFKDMYPGKPGTFTRTIGEAAVMTRFTMDYDYANTTISTIAITFRVDRVFALLILADATGNWPLTTQAEVLAERLVGRIENGLNGDTPNVSSRMMRLNADFEFDWYEAIDGTVVPRFGYAPPASNLVATGKFLDAFDAFHEVELGDPSRYDDNATIAFLHYRFDNKNDAQAWFGETESRVSQGKQDFTLERSDEFGDEAVIVTFVRPDARNGIDLYTRGIVVRVDNFVIELAVVDLQPVAAPGVEALMSMQLDCLEQDDCRAYRSIPDGVFAER